MRLSLATLTLPLLVTVPCVAQQTIPPVSALIKQYDQDADGKLTAEDVAKSRYARQFPRWDQDQDGKVTADEIIAFRRRYGIAADGSRIAAAAKPLKIPDTESLARVDRTHPPSRDAARNSAYILRTQPHRVTGQEYVILTDHLEPAYVQHLQRLAKHRAGSLLTVKNLTQLPDQPDERARIRSRLRQAKYVAIAPRKESYRENTLLALWELLSTIDDDPQIDVFPGLLLATDAASLGTLVDQSIRHRPLPAEEVKPLAISQCLSVNETRSLQKAGILRKQFAKTEQSLPIVAIYGKQAAAAPKLSGPQVWNLTTSDKQKFVREFPRDVTQVMDQSSLWILHGHGVPGMSCSVDVDGLPTNMRGKLLLTGSCFSAVPWQSDLPKLREAPGGYQVQPRDAFVLRAIDRGAVVAFGHQRLSSGFPHLYPILESWQQGQTVGQSYQQLLNALIALTQLQPQDFVIRDVKQRRIPQNRLLYVLIGDPALQPLAARD